MNSFDLPRSYGQDAAMPALNSEQVSADLASGNLDQIRQGDSALHALYHWIECSGARPDRRYIEQLQHDALIGAFDGELIGLAGHRRFGVRDCALHLLTHSPMGLDHIGAHFGIPAEGGQSELMSCNVLPGGSQLTCSLVSITPSSLIGVFHRTRQTFRAAQSLARACLRAHRMNRRKNRAE